MTRFVLVHGAFHGAWCWDGVATRLRSAGHRVLALDLPGAGSDTTAIEAVTLAAYRDRIVEVLAGDPEPAVLVGHSMGGVAITEAAAQAPQHVAQLVYVAAFLPSTGESVMSLAQKPEGAGENEMVIEGDPPVALLPREAALRVFYAECAPDVAEMAVDRLGPQAMLPFFEQVTVPESVHHVRRYVITLRDQAIPVALQRRMATDNPCDEVVEMNTDHSPFLSRPDELIAHLARFASA